MKKDEIISINGQMLPVREYNGQRVVTIADIAIVHGISKKNIQENFRNNRKHFIENTDYFHLKGKKAIQNIWVGSSTTTQINVFSETGYLMLVKSLTDDLSWQVQRELVNGYFRTVNRSQGSATVAKVSDLGRLRQNLLESGAREALLDILPVEYKTLLRYSKMKLSEDETATLMKMSTAEINKMQQSLKMAGLLESTLSLTGIKGSIICVKCGYHNSRVIDTRKTLNGVHRIRVCSNCGHTFETIEKPVEVT